MNRIKILYFLLLFFQSYWVCADVPDPISFGTNCRSDENGKLNCIIPPAGSSTSGTSYFPGVGGTGGSNSGNGTGVGIGGAGTGTVNIGNVSGSPGSSSGGFNDPTGRAIHDYSTSISNLMRDLENIRNEAKLAANTIINEPERLAHARTMAEDAIKIEEEYRNTIERAAILKPEREKYLTFKTPYGTPEWKLLRKMRERQIFTRKWLDNEGENLEYRGLRHQLIGFADVMVAAADEAFVTLESHLGNNLLKQAGTALDLAVDFTPGLSFVKDVISVLTSINPITLKNVTNSEKAFILATLAIPATINGMSKLAKLLKGVTQVAGPRGQNAQFLLDVIKHGDEELKVLSHSPLEKEIGAETDEFIKSAENLFERKATKEELSGVEEYLKKNANDLSEGTENVLKESRPYFKSWKPHYQFKRKIDADTINKEFIDAGRQPPFEPGTKVFEFTTSEPDIWVRLHGTDNKVGSWIVRKEAINGMLPEQLQMKYALPTKPSYVSEVHVPVGTNIRKGKIGANNFGDSEGAVQYQLLDRLDIDFFKNTTEIKGTIK